MAYKRFPDSSADKPIRYLTEEQALSVGITPAAYQGKPGKPGRPGKDGKDGIEVPSPQIGDNGNWYTWNHDLKQWVDTGKPASVVNAVYTVPTKDHLPEIGRNGIIYVVEQENCIYRWDNQSQGYLEIHTNGKADNCTPSTRVFKQNVATKVWTIQHNMSKYPSVIVVDSAGSQVFGDVVYLDINSLQITFTSEFGGKVYLN